MAEDFVLVGLRILSLIFADNEVLLASSCSRLQFALEWLAAKCEAEEMITQTSKEFKYLWVLFMTEGRWEREIGRLKQISAVTAAL